MNNDGSLRFKVLIQDQVYGDNHLKSETRVGVDMEVGGPDNDREHKTVPPIIYH